MTKEVKDMILDFHNSKQNDVAMGKVSQLEPVKRMATMVSGNAHIKSNRLQKSNSITLNRLGTMTSLKCQSSMYEPANSDMIITELLVLTQIIISFEWEYLGKNSLSFICPAKFRSPGQNIGIALYDTSYRSYDDPPTKSIKNLIKDWFDTEYKNVDMSIIL